MLPPIALVFPSLVPAAPLHNYGPFSSPCYPQYTLAAHSVSQLHAVDGGTTYGLPYDSLMPPIREKGKAELSCKGVGVAMSWWLRLGSTGGFRLVPCPLSPRGVFELCLRKAEVAADCWRRRNGLPGAAAAAAAAGGSAGDSGGGVQRAAEALMGARQPGVWARR